MIIGCPSCSARFVLPEGALGENGRKVRCAKCLHVWFHPASPKRYKKPDPPAFKPAPPPPQPSATEPRALPVPTPSGRFRYDWAVFSVCFVWLAGFTFYLFSPALVRNFSFLQPICLPLGVTPTDGVALYDTKIEKTKENGKDAVILSGVITNEAEEPRRIPDLQITQRNAQGEIVETTLLESGFPVVRPGGEISYRNVVTLASSEVSHVVIDVGHRIELSRRNMR